MKLYSLIFFGFFLLVGCSTAPIYAKLDDGRLLQGSGMNGHFLLRDLDGLSCEGEYPPVSLRTTLDLSLHCSDGRTGLVILTLNDPDFSTGYGRGKFSDGQKFEVFLGNVSQKLTAPKFLR